MISRTPKCWGGATIVSECNGQRARLQVRLEKQKWQNCLHNVEGSLKQGFGQILLSDGQTVHEQITCSLQLEHAQSSTRSGQMSKITECFLISLRQNEKLRVFPPRPKQNCAGTSFLIWRTIVHWTAQSRHFSCRPRRQSTSLTFSRSWTLPRSTATRRTSSWSPSWSSLLLTCTSTLASRTGASRVHHAHTWLADDLHPVRCDPDRRHDLRSHRAHYLLCTWETWKRSVMGYVGLTNVAKG